MKEEIRRDLRAGRTEEEILRAYVDRYGIRVLTEPPPAGFHRILGVAPIVLFVASLLALLGVLHHWRRRAVAVPAPPPAPDTLRRIEREMQSR